MKLAGQGDGRTMWPCAFSWWVQEQGQLESIGLLEEGQEQGGSEGLSICSPLGTQRSEWLPQGKQRAQIFGISEHGSHHPALIYLF